VLANKARRRKRPLLVAQAAGVESQVAAPAEQPASPAAQAVAVAAAAEPSFR